MGQFDFTPTSAPSRWAAATMRLMSTVESGELVGASGQPQWWERTTDRRWYGRVDSPVHDPHGAIVLTNVMSSSPPMS